MWEAICKRKVPVYEDISKFPAVRRDLAFVVNKDVKAADLCSLIRKIGGSLVKQVVIFDVFEGEFLGEDKRSIALGVIIQDPNTTLEDKQTDALVEDIVKACNKELGATLRS